MQMGITAAGTRAASVGRLTRHVYRVGYPNALELNDWLGQAIPVS